MYPIISLIKIHDKHELIKNIINIIESDIFEIKLEYIQTDTLFFEDFYIYHEFYFLYKDNKFYTSHTINYNDSCEKSIIKTYSHEYSCIKLCPPTNIIEFLFVVHNSSISDLSIAFDSVKI